MPPTNGGVLGVSDFDMISSDRLCRYWWGCRARNCGCRETEGLESFDGLIVSWAAHTIANSLQYIKFRTARSSSASQSHGFEAFTKQTCPGDVFSSMRLHSSKVTRNRRAINPPWKVIITWPLSRWDSSASSPSHACIVSSLLPPPKVQRKLITMSLQVNLPWFITVHALGLTSLGLYLTFTTSKPSSTLGIATLGLGLAYLSTSYVPMEENQFLYATVPVRMILASVAGLKVLLAGREIGMEEKRALLGIAIYDGLGGVVLGWRLGGWSGRVPGVWGVDERSWLTM